MKSAFLLLVLLPHLATSKFLFKQPGCPCKVIFQQSKVLQTGQQGILGQLKNNRKETWVKIAKARDLIRGDITGVKKDQQKTQAAIQQCENFLVSNVSQVLENQASQKIQLEEFRQSAEDNFGKTRTKQDEVFAAIADSQSAIENKVAYEHRLTRAFVKKSYLINYALIKIVLGEVKKLHSDIDELKKKVLYCCHGKY